MALGISSMSFWETAMWDSEDIHITIQIRLSEGTFRFLQKPPIYTCPLSPCGLSVE